eukprot:6041741-Prorocentrum_lima.AAC.1
MSVCRRGGRELRGDKEESLLKKEVGKKVPMHRGARLSMSFMLTHKAGVVNAGEPAVAINAYEEARPEKRTEVREECSILL